MTSIATQVEFDHELDVRGQSCPLPIISARKALDGLTAGQVLKVRTTDKGSTTDFPAFVQQTALTLDAFAEIDGEYHYYIRKP
jgi:tRNA 2-thiouridine synthesizing protein A